MRLPKLYQNAYLQLLLLLAPIAVVVFSMICYLHINRFGQYIVTQQLQPTSATVGVVLGGGVRNGEPLPLLKDRLDRAKQLLESGQVKKLILSGDNRFENYNEPTVMLDYLTRQGVDESKIQLDFAGRSSYETCERASKVFGLKTAFFISEDTHLPRVLYLCRHFGIEAYGIASNGQAADGLQIGQRWREILARDKAIINVNVKGEETVLGDPINF